MSAPILRAQTVRSLADLAEMDVAEVERALGMEPGTKKSRPAPRRLERQRVVTSTRQLLRLLTARPELCIEVPDDAGTLISDDTEREILQLLCERAQSGTVISLNALFESQTDAGRRNLIADLLTTSDEEHVSEEDAADVLADTLRTLRRNSVERQIENLTQRANSGNLSPDEKRHLTELLLQKQTLKSGQKPPV
jgi:hypothetical protein